MTAALILAAWLALLVGFVGGLALHAYRLEGVALITRRFVAEIATLCVGLGYVLYGLQPTLIAFGVVP
jgi:hypothetical protein